MIAILSVNADLFYREGRGPELLKVHYGSDGRVLKAIDSHNPDYSDDIADLKHLLFIRAQVFMFTPEEVTNYGYLELNQASFGNAALFSLGRSAWLLSFAPYHLTRCSHFGLCFTMNCWM